MDILHAAGESVIKIKSELKKFLVQRKKATQDLQRAFIILFCRLFADNAINHKKLET